MEQKYLLKVLENEERINKFVEVLALSPAEHFQIEYTNAEIEICAYTHKFTDSQHTEILLSSFALKADRIETTELENSSGKFWVTRLYITIQ